MTWRSHFVRAVAAAGLLAIFSVSPRFAHGDEAEYAVGADLSSVGHAERAGPVFKDGGEPKPALQIFKDHGYNWVRLRLFHTPTRLPNNLEYTIALAKQAKQLGYKFLLDFHYSDTWADPQKQFIPKAWEKMSHEEMVEAVFAYTRDSIAAFREGWCHARHGSSWQRNYRRHALAGWSVAK